MLGYKGPAQPSPALGDALNAGYRYLEVRCLGYDTHQTVALDIVRRPKTMPIHELERYMRCKDYSRFEAIHTSAAISLRCDRPRSRRVILRRPGGLVNADVQSLLNHHEPSSHHRAVSCHQPLRRQPAADARCFFPAPVVRDDDGEREVVMMRVFGTRSEAHNARSCRRC